MKLCVVLVNSFCFAFHAYENKNPKRLCVGLV